MYVFRVNMVSSGMSEEAWEYLKFGHIKAEIRDGQIIAAKMVVNVGKKNTKKRHRYITFITPEAWNALEEWKNFRESWGLQTIHGLSVTDGRPPI